MTILVVLALLVALGPLSARYGRDSREWQDTRWSRRWNDCCDARTPVSYLRLF